MPYGNMSPQSLAIDCLNSLKFLSICDAFETLESSTPQIREMFSRASQEHARMADEWFRLMSRKGWYQMVPARMDIQSQVASHLNNMISQTVSPAYQAQQPGPQTGYQFTGQTTSFPTVIPPQTM